MTAEPFEYPRSEWPPNVVLVGPCAWDPPARLPAELEGVEEPLVLVSTSSEFQDDGRLVRAAIEGLAGEPFHVVATLPEASAERAAGRRPRDRPLLRAPRPDPRPRGLRDHPRRHGRHPEGAVAGRAGLRRALRPRPVRRRPAGRGGGRRNPPAGAAAAPRKAALQGPRGDREAARCRAGRGGLRGGRRVRCGGGCPRAGGEPRG